MAMEASGAHASPCLSRHNSPVKPNNRRRPLRVCAMESHCHQLALQPRCHLGTLSNAEGVGQCAQWPERGGDRGGPVGPHQQGARAAGARAPGGGAQLALAVPGAPPPHAGAPLRRGLLLAGRPCAAQKKGAHHGTDWQQDWSFSAHVLLAVILSFADPLRHHHCSGWHRCTLNIVQMHPLKLDQLTYVSIVSPNSGCQIGGVTCLLCAVQPFWRCQACGC